MFAMKTRSLVVLFVLVVGGAMVALFSGGSERGTRAASPPARTADAAEPAADAVPSLPEIDRSEAGRSAAELSIVAPGPEEDIDFDTVRAVPVRVVLPIGVPADDELMLDAYVHAAPGSLDEILEGRPRLEHEHHAIVAQPEETPVRVSRQTIEGSGVIDVPFPEGAANIAVFLDSRYVTSAPVYFSPDDPMPTIEGTLGTWISGTVLFPEEDSAPIPAPEALSVAFTGRGQGGFFAARFGTDFQAEVDADYHFEARGVPSDKTYLVQLPVEGRVDFLQRSLEVEPGEHVTLDIPLAVGASVHGIVVGEDGTPISGATVVGYSTKNVLARALGGRESTDTDENGAFSLTGIPPRKIELTASAAGHLESEPVPLELEEGEVAEGVRILLPSGNRLGGRVLWPGGAPAEGAKVTVEDVGRTAVADDAGRFEVSGLGEGPFDLTARARKSSPEGVNGQGIEWIAVARNVAAGTEGVELMLEAPRVIRGIVVDDLGEPIPEFQVEATEAGKPYWETVIQGGFEDDSGSFELKGFVDGDWTLRAEADGYVATGVDEGVGVTVPQSDAPVRIVLQRALRVAGTVVDPGGAPVPGAEVRFDSGPRSGRFWSSSTSRTADDRGHFEFGGLPAEGAALTARAEGWAPSEPTPVAGDPGATVQDVTLRLRVGATITGEVYDKEGNPDANAAVSVSGSGFANPFLGENTTTTDAAGKFRVEHVLPGKVRVFATPPEDDLFESLDTAESEEQAMTAVLGQIRSASVEVDDGEEVHVTLGFPARKPVHVTGTVHDGSEPVADAVIIALEEKGSLSGGIQATRSDAAGRFEVTVNLPGDYVFQVQSEDENPSPVLFPVTVPDEPEYDLDLELPNGVLAGIVLSADGDPAANVGFRVRRPGPGGGMLAFTQGNRRSTGADGRFRVEHLAPGTYTLVFGDPWSTFDQGRTDLATTVAGPLDLAEGEVRDDLVVRVERPGKIVGIVRDADGNPVPGAAVWARDASGQLLNLIATTRTNASGSFTYSGVPPGKAWVFARKGELSSPEVGPVIVAPNAEVSAELTLGVGSSLVITFEVDGEPARATITVSDENGNQVSGLATAEELRDLFASKGPQREYRVGPLPPGKYTVRGTDSEGHTARKTIRVDDRGRERRVRLRAR